MNLDDEMVSLVELKAKEKLEIMSKALIKIKLLGVLNSMMSVNQ